MGEMATVEHTPRVTIFGDSGTPGEYGWSPFVTKLEARLRFDDFGYDIQQGSFPNAPRAKLPFVQVSAVDTTVETLSDSSLIIRHLVDNGLLVELNENLNSIDKAHDLAIRALLEDKLYFYEGHEKWSENYYNMRDRALASIPYPLRIIVGLIVYRKAMGALWGQGTGRFTRDEILSFQREGWESIDALLVVSKKKSKGDEPYWILGGERPTEADASLFGMIVASFVTNAAPKGRKIVEAQLTVVDYARRIHDRYFPEYKLWEKTLS